MGIDGQDGKDSAAAPLLLLKQEFPDDVSETSQGGADAVAIILPGSLRRIMEFLKNDPRLYFNVRLDVTAVDLLGKKPRFELGYHLLSLPFTRRLRVKTAVDDAQPIVDSLCRLWESANWLEREVWDMFGIRFAGHPNLKRILMYEEFEGHPLRKDYPIRKRQPLIGPRN